MILRTKSWVFVASFVLLLTSSGLGQSYVNISHSPSWQSDCPRICVDTAGNIHAVWAEIYTISGISFLSGDAFYAKYDITTKQWSAPLNLSNSGLVANSEGYLVDIACDGSGLVYAVYVNNNQILLRILSGGKWGTAVEVGTNSSTIDEARIVVTPQGDIFTCWWQLSSMNIYSRARIGGVWESVKALNSAGVMSKFPAIAVGKSAAYCTWMGVADANYHVIVSGRALTAGSSWTAPARATTSPDQEQQPAVAVDSSDVAHIVYTPEFDMQRTVRYVFGTVAGFSAPIDLSGKEGLHYPAIYAGGKNLYVCWQAVRGVGYASRIDGSWSAAAVLPGTAAINALTDVATSPDQTSIYFVWESGSGLGTDIFFGAILGTPANIPPTAAFSFSPTTAIYPANITFDATASVDPDGSITQYAWNFGDDGVGSGKTVTHNYKTFGTFAIRLTVTDDKGSTGSITKTLQITRLFQPLNIQVTSHADESLFRVRFLNVVTWESNPANTSIGATISTYRVYRKKKAEALNAYAAIADVPGDTFTYTDKTANTAAEKDLYAYTVTALNSEGKESPILGSLAGSTQSLPQRALIRKSKLKR